MKEGALIDYTIKRFGLRLRWTTLITVYAPPYQFCDVQLRGPYAFWHHTHLFKEISQGTLMTDEVKYALPFGILGECLHFLKIRNELDEIFNFRAKTIETLLAGNVQS